MLVQIRKITIRVLVFIAVAMSTAFFVNKFQNGNMDRVYTEMDEPKLPIVFCNFDGEPINMMRGYTHVMNTSLMRQGIIPLNENHGVDILVYDDTNYGCSYSYELRTIDGDSLIENGTVEPGEQEHGYENYSVSFRMDTKKNAEYVMVFIITNEAGEQARYYSRVVDLEDNHAKEILRYARSFHNTTFVKEVDEEEGNLVYDLLNTTGEGADKDMSHVNLNSSYEMVSWAGMNPIVMTAIIPTITEIDREYAVVALSYVIENDTEENEHYYNIEEYYSARYDTVRDNVELLAFDRYQESIFDTSFISKDKNGISLGITDIHSVEYRCSSDNKKLAFVKEGNLYLYDYDTMQLTNVFDLLQGNYSNLRSINNELDINIAYMDDAGNMYFIVYGYFPRGKHEGKNGISLYYFDVENSKIEEQCFIICDEPYDVMKTEVGRFTYYDEEGYMYYLLNGSIYKVDLGRMTQDVIYGGIPSDKFLVSDNRKIVVFPNSGNEEEVTSLTLKNFETGTEKSISGSATDRFLGLGYVGNDLIYGVTNKEDIIISAGNSATMPLYSLIIMDPEGNILKNYQKENIYIMDVDVQADNIYLSRYVKNNNFFDETDADYISYKAVYDRDEMVVTHSVDNEMLKVVDIVFPANMYISDNYKPVMTKNITSDAYKEMRVKVTASQYGYYVFDNSGYVGGYDSAGKAIVAVESINTGIVVDSRGNTIYRGIEVTGYNTVASKIEETPCENINQSELTCAYMCIEYVNSKAVYEDVMSASSWEEAFENNTYGVGINISGISLDTALYFLDRDIPFAARIGDGRYVLVISYNSTHIRYYDPIAGEEVRVTRKDFSDSLSLWGNTMYSYTSQ